MKPIIIAHRGDTINYNQNTFPAFESAFKLGADGIELDTHLDKNGNIIVVHDFSFNPNQNYPLLEDVLNEFSKKGMLEIELKSPYPESIIKTIDIIKKYNPPNFEITSSIMPHLPKVRNLLPDAKIGLIFSTSLISDWMTKDYINLLLESYMELVEANVLHLPIDNYNESNVEFLKSKGYMLHAHLAYEIKKFQKVLDLQIEQCTLDDVTKINYLKSLQDYFGQTD